MRLLPLNLQLSIHTLPPLRYPFVVRCRKVINRMKRILHLVVSWPKTIVFIILLCSIPFVYAFFQKSYLNHVGLYFEEDDPSLVAYKNFQKTYGNEEMALIAIHGDNIFSQRGLDTIRAISNLAKNSAGVERVFSLTEATDAVGEDDAIRFESFIPEGDLSKEDIKRIKKRVLTHETVSKTFISPDGKTTAVFLELEVIASDEYKGELLTRIQEKAEKIAGKDFQLYFAGIPFVEYAITYQTQKDDLKFTPLAIAAIFLMTFLFFREVSMVSLCLFNILIVLAWSVGLFVLTGHRFMMITVVMPPILLAIAVADTVHIISHFKAHRKKEGQDLSTAVYETIRELWLPCLFTSLTTGIGFLSFMTATIGPVRTLGLYTFIGVVIAYFMSIVLLPPILLLYQRYLGDRFQKDPVKSPSENQKDPVERTIRAIGEFTIRHYLLISVVFLGIMGLALTGAMKIYYETNFVNFLSKSSRLRRDMQFIEKHLYGTVPLALLIRAKSPRNDFTHPESLQLIDEIQNKIEKKYKDEYASFFSIADYFKSLHRAFNGGDDNFYKLPDNPDDVLDYYEFGEVETIDRIVSPDKMEARISFSAYIGPTAEGGEFDTFLKNIAEEMLDNKFDYYYTGLGSLYVAMDRNLRTSQMRSFSAASIIIFFMMWVVCKNLKLTLISMLPNLFPIVCTFGLMGFFGIPLDVSTIMIASVTIGIAVDDTIHFIVWYRRNIESGMTIESALRKTYRDTGKPIFITSIVLMIAFFVFISGSVQPVIAFGILAGFAMLFALVGDFFLLPAIILVFKVDFRKKGARAGNRLVFKESGYGPVNPEPSLSFESKNE